MKTVLKEWLVLVFIFAGGQLAMDWFRARDTDLLGLTISTGVFAVVYLLVAPRFKKLLEKKP